MDLDEEINFKCGLEIHQQLDTSKLFCRCPSVLRKDEPDFLVRRKLHAVAGEVGEVDVSALYQASLEKEFTYQGYDSTCLVELDEEPPYEINMGALEIALHISFLLNCKIIPITQVMRKMVIDGSNTSGFQRSVLISEKGYVDVMGGKVGVDYIYLEEDAARIIERKEKKETYRLDRLGVPLVEIVTSPDIKSPQHAKEVALHIGDILRSCKVKRGIGTIRQDVNISIKEENRVEIKGMQDMNIFIKAIENEISRQKKLSESENPVGNEVRNVLPKGKSEFLRPLPGSARMYPETDLPVLKISRDFINQSKKSLPRLREELKKELRKKGLNHEIIKLLLKREKLDDFMELSSVIEKPQLIAKMLLIFPKEISVRQNKSFDEIEKKLNKDVFTFVLENLNTRKISEEHVKDILELIAKGKSPKDAVKIEKVDVSDLEEKIMKMIKQKPGLSEKAYMGLAMKELGLKGKVSGKEIFDIIKKLNSNI